MRFRCGGIFIDWFIANFLVSAVPVQVNRVATNMENLEYSGIYLNTETQGILRE